MGIPAEWLQFAPKPRPLTGNDKWNVFLSYRSVNRTWVLNLYDILRELGHQVFLDQVVLTGGNPLIRSLQAALEASQAGILVWTGATRDSEWVQREYETLERQATEKRDFCFVPIRLDASKLPVFAQNRIFLDFSAYPDGPNGGELLRLLHAIVGKPLSDDAAHYANNQDDLAKELANRIGAAVLNKRPDRLVALAQQDGVPWRTSAVLGCKASEGLTKLGENDLAIQALEKLREQFPRAIRPRQLLALALARRKHDGDLDKAQEILGELYEAGERDPETLGIYARTWMDRYDNSKDISDLRRSRGLYADAFAKAPDDYYTGINAAAKSVFLGTPADLQLAAQYAQKVQEIVGKVAVPDDYWRTATIAELFLIQKEYESAGQLYEAAVATAPCELGSHKTTWLQCKRLLEKLQPTPEQRALVSKAFAHLPA